MLGQVDLQGSDQISKENYSYRECAIQIPTIYRSPYWSHAYACAVDMHASHIPVCVWFTLNFML
jgi:hypothetical protein